MENIRSFKNKNNQESLRENYNEALKDPYFKKLVNNLKLEDIAINNTSLIMDSAQELKNCADCLGLYQCQNKVRGYYLYPKRENNILETAFVACKYEKEHQELLANKITSNKILANANFKEIDMSDKNRIKLIKWIKEFYDNYDEYKDMKGLYLHGVFGSGKTYLIYALLNELKNKKHIDYIAIYFPQILKDLKDDWDSYGEKMNRYATVPILLIDDIGAESVSEWGRDEVLGTILQNRMNNHLTTFFTSNLTIEELDSHLATTKTTTDKVKSRRIIERIKQLTEDLELISKNRRQ